jgi:hypothetical protein
MYLGEMLFETFKYENVDRALCFTACSKRTIRQRMRDLAPYQYRDHSQITTSLENESLRTDIDRMYEEGNWVTGQSGMPQN